MAFQPGLLPSGPHPFLFPPPPTFLGPTRQLESPTETVEMIRSSLDQQCVLKARRRSTSTPKPHVPLPRQPCFESSFARSPASSGPFINGYIPPEILTDIFYLAGNTAAERLAYSQVCRWWRGPAQAALWTDLRFDRARQLLAACTTIFEYGREDLARSCRTFSFEPAFPQDNIDDGPTKEAALRLAAKLTGLRSVHIQIDDVDDRETELNVGLFWQLCGNFSHRLTTLDFACEGGTFISHLFVAFRLPNLADLRIGHLNTFMVFAEDDDEAAALQSEDLEKKEAEEGDDDWPAWWENPENWPVPPRLTNLTLFKPEVDAKELIALLLTTSATVRSLNFQFGDAPAGVLTKEVDVEAALLAAGAHIVDLTVLWPSCNRFFLNDAIRGMPSCSHVATGGLTCTADMDKNCPPALRSMTLFVQVGYRAANFERLWKPGFRVSNVTHYRVITRNTYPLDKLEETWTDQRTREWSEAKVALDKVGITIEGDFF